MNLMQEYHNRSDHGRDGMYLGGLTCNCEQLFSQYYQDAFNDGVEWAVDNLIKRS